MGQLNQTTQQNARASEELAATAEEMSGQAEQLAADDGILQGGYRRHRRESGRGPARQLRQRQRSDGQNGNCIASRQPHNKAEFVQVLRETAMGALVRTTAMQAPVVQKEAGQYLTFLLGSEMFAMDILGIKEIIEYGNLTACR